MQNHLGQPIGEPLDWRGATPPPRTTLAGQYCSIVPLDESQAEDLFTATQLDPDGRNWTYLFEAPFDRLADFTDWLQVKSQSKDPLFHAIISAETGKALGYASLMRIDPAMGCIEIGNIHLSPGLQRSRAATEAMYLLMKQVFELGYRRYEWKCDSLNAASRKAATRLGFTFEGIFRQAVVYKSRNRDSAWFSVLDSEWPALRQGFETWLNPANFDHSGKQLAKLHGAR